MSTRRLFLVAALLTAVAAIDPIHGAERVSIRVTPGVAFAPAEVTVKAMIEPNAANRTIEVTADSGEYLRRSQAGLEGDAAPRANQFRFPGLPAGKYEIRVAVKGTSGQELASAVAQLTVVGEPERDEQPRVP